MRPRRSAASYDAAAMAVGASPLVDLVAEDVDQATKTPLGRLKSARGLLRARFRQSFVPVLSEKHRIMMLCTGPAAWPPKPAWQRVVHALPSCR